jgi:hypothetical protein
VLLVLDDGEWIATWNAESDTELYVDVTSRPVRGDGVIEAVDLDLDVIRRRDGRVEVLDEDEFAEHQVLLGYPPDVIAQARATTDDLVARIRAAREPLAGSARIGLPPTRPADPSPATGGRRARAEGERRRPRPGAPPLSDKWDGASGTGPATAGG